MSTGSWKEQSSSLFFCSSLQSPDKCPASAPICCSRFLKCNWEWKKHKRPTWSSNTEEKTRWGRALETIKQQERAVKTELPRNPGKNREVKCPVRAERWRQKSICKRNAKQNTVHEATELCKLGRGAKQGKYQQTCKEVFGCLLPNWGKRNKQQLWDLQYYQVWQEKPFPAFPRNGCGWARRWNLASPNVLGHFCNISKPW